MFQKNDNFASIFVIDIGNVKNNDKPTPATKVSPEVISATDTDYQVVGGADRAFG